MARVHMNVRVTAEVLAGVDAYAEEQSITRSAATEQLLQTALESGEQEQPETASESADMIAAMQAHIATLHEQLAMKDEQIARLNKTADQAQALHMQLMRALPMAQDTPGQPIEQESGHKAPQDGQMATEGAGQPQDGAKRGFWARFWG